MKLSGIFCLCALASIVVMVSLFAQPATTVVNGPVYDQYGNPYSGSLTITISARTATSGGQVILANPMRLYVTNGALSVSLVPNSSITPGGTTYLFVFGNYRQAICTVPSGSPVSIGGICTYAATPSTGVAWGTIIGSLPTQTDLYTYLQGTQPLITPGTTSQYYRGDLTFQNLTSSVVTEGTNLYFTNGRAQQAAPVQTSVGSGSPSGPCMGPTGTFLQFYADSTGHHLYFCAANNSWVILT